MLRNTNRNHGSLSKWLHAISALCVVTLLILGYLTTTIQDKATLHSLYFYHKSLGLTLFFIMFFRLVWRLTNPRPQHGNMAPIQVATATLVHYLLYLAVFVMIIAGVTMTYLKGHTIPFWGLFQTSPAAVPNKPLGHIFGIVHYWGAWILFGLILLHALAALYHQFILRDNLIGGILPQKKRDIFQ